jgi:hypothetical protein
MGADDSATVPRRKRWLRTALAAVLSLLIALLPLVGAIASYAVSGEPVEPDLMFSGVYAGVVLVALAWLGAGLFRLVKRMNRLAASTTNSSGPAIRNPELLRAVLAEHDLSCVRCDYNLRGLSAAICPECQEPITVHLAGADPLRPVVWAARLAVAACGVFGVRGGLELWRLVRMWGFLPMSGVGGGWRLRVALVLPCAVDLGALLVIAFVALAWARAGPGRARGVSRWRALNIAVGLLALMGAVDVLAWTLYF